MSKRKKRRIKDDANLHNALRPHKDKPLALATRVDCGLQCGCGTIEGRRALEMSIQQAGCIRVETSRQVSRSLR